MKKDAIAVLDIGKTNKKIVLFDLDLNVLEIRKQAFPAGVQGGLLVDQPDKVLKWFLITLSQLTSQYHIRAISVTTHGAQVVFLKADGSFSAPPLCYTNTADKAFADEFYVKFGSREALHVQTLTPEIGHMVNLAKLIFFTQKKFPESITATRHILPFPQYFVYKLTGRACIEPTMLGCHSYLLDARTRGYSHLVDALNIKHLLPQTISNSWDSAGRVSRGICRKYSLPEDCIVTTGIHDSNSSLLPYLVTEEEDFVLNSTGTWCVAMRPSGSTRLDQNQIGKTVFYNFDVFKKPVKTCIFPGGMEFEKYYEILRKIHGTARQPEINEVLYAAILKQADTFILPSIMEGTGIFPDQIARAIEKGETFLYHDIEENKHVPEFFKYMQLADAVLNISLAIQSAIAIEHTGYICGNRVFIEGGFTGNIPYLSLLASLLPGSDVYTSTMPEATATGAAILALAALAGRSPNKLALRLHIETAEYIPNLRLDCSEYKERYLQLLV
jgi:L-fuculokinase